MYTRSERQSMELECFAALVSQTVHGSTKKIVEGAIAPNAGERERARTGSKRRSNGRRVLVVARAYWCKSLL